MKVKKQQRVPAPGLKWIRRHVTYIVQGCAIVRFQNNSNWLCNANPSLSLSINRAKTKHRPRNWLSIIRGLSACLWYAYQVMPDVLLDVVRRSNLWGYTCLSLKHSTQHSIVRNWIPSRTMDGMKELGVQDFYHEVILYTLAPYCLKERYWWTEYAGYFPWRLFLNGARGNPVSVERPGKDDF